MRSGVTILVSGKIEFKTLPTPPPHKLGKNSLRQKDYKRKKGTFYHKLTHKDNIKIINIYTTNKKTPKYMK